MRQGEGGVGEQRLAVGQGERQVADAQIAATTLGHDVDGGRRLFVGGRLQALQTVHDGAQLSQRGVVVDEERQRPLDLAKGGGRLGHHAQGDGAGEETGRRHDEGKDDGELGITLLVDEELRLGEQDPPAVGEDVGEARIQRLRFTLFATVQGDALGILAHPDQREAEVRLELLLLEVQRD